MNYGGHEKNLTNDTGLIALSTQGTMEAKKTTTKMLKQNMTTLGATGILLA